MATANPRFAAFLDANDLAVEVKAFPQGTRTAADAASAIGCDVAQIVKSLVFMADDAPVLVLTSGVNRVDEARLASTLGATSLRKANADEVRASTGYAIGGTPPFGHVQPIAVVCDRDLTTHEYVWAAAGTPQHVFAITPGELLAQTDAQVVDL